MDVLNLKFVGKPQGQAPRFPHEFSFLVQELNLSIVILSKAKDLLCRALPQLKSRSAANAQDDITSQEAMRSTMDVLNLKFVGKSAQRRLEQRRPFNAA